MPAVYSYSARILLQLHIGVQVFVGMMLVCSKRLFHSGLPGGAGAPPPPSPLSWFLHCFFTITKQFHHSSLKCMSAALSVSIVCSVGAKL